MAGKTREQALHGASAWTGRLCQNSRNASARISLQTESNRDHRIAPQPPQSPLRCLHIEASSAAVPTASKAPLAEASELRKPCYQLVSSRTFSAACLGEVSAMGQH